MNLISKKKNKKIQGGTEGSWVMNLGPIKKKRV